MINNAISSVVTASVNGVSCIFYLSAGGVISGVVFNLYKICFTYKDSGELKWHPQGFMINGKLV